MKHLFITTILISMLSCTFGHDVIVLKNGSTIEAKVIYSDKEGIYFNSISRPDDPRTLEIIKPLVKMIQFEDGTVEQFEDQIIQTANADTIVYLTLDSYQNVAINDIKDFSTNGYYWATFGASTIGALVSYVPIGLTIRGDNSFGAGVFFLSSGFLTGAISGGITTLILNKSKKKVEIPKHLNYDKNDDIYPLYSQYYQKEVARKKSKSLWSGLGSGLGLSFLGGLLFLGLR